MMKNCFVLFIVVSISLSAQSIPLNPKSFTPKNVNINYTDSLFTIIWDSVPSVDLYYIYSKNDLNGISNLIDSTTTNKWTGNCIENCQFFEVSSSVPEAPQGFVFIKGNTFQMGDNFAEGDSDELPVHLVKVSGFYMSETKVTQKEWTDIMGSNPAYGSGVGDNYPVYKVNWYQLLKYCNLRSIADGLTPCYTILDSTDPADWGAVPSSYFNIYWDAVTCDWDADGYRLPTEAEWELAARGGLSGQRFPNGETISQDATGDNQANYYSYWEWGIPYFSYDVNPTEGYPQGYYRTTTPVKTYPPNGFGLYDMSGNVFDLCWDLYGSDYYTVCSEQGTVIEPKGPESSSFHVGRGGFWDYHADDNRVANRYYFVAFNIYGNAGFRVVRSH